MEKREIALIMSTIMRNFKSEVQRIGEEEYYLNLQMFLKDKDFEMVMKNLFKHIEDSEYAPKIKHLIKNHEDLSFIPNALQTRLMIEKKEKESPNIEIDRNIVKEMVRKHKEKMAEERYNEYKRNITESKG